MTIATLLTCYNRKEYTIQCIKTLSEQNPSLDFVFVVVDDGSKDGTVEELQKLSDNIVLLHGTGSLFWNGGMYLAIDYAMNKLSSIDYILLVNDDVNFYPKAIEKMIKRAKDNDKCVVVGSTEDNTGEISYGGIRKKSNFMAKFELIKPSVEPVLCDTFNCNCVLIPQEQFLICRNLDSYYKHSMGDYDYGMKIRRLGIPIINSSEHIGTCSDNAVGNTWRDRALTRRKRLELKESPKGLPKKDWFHFIYKNYGLLSAIYHSITPYIRILLKK